MADRPIKELDYLTPLETAKPENMNELASLGISGLLYAISPGVVPGSDVANLAIIGYDPFKFYTGRGVFEATGAGITLNGDDLAFRFNFATVSDDFTVVDEHAGRIRTGTEELLEALKDLNLKSTCATQVVFGRTLGFKGALVLRGKDLSYNVAVSMPKKGFKADSIQPLDGSANAKKTAEILNTFIRETYRVLRDHPVNKKRKQAGLPPANVVIPWGVGKPSKLEPFEKKYNLKGACVAAVNLIKGMCKLAGMTVMDVPEATGDVDTNTLAKAEAALNALKTHDFVLVHVEGPDEASHEGDVEGKISIIKKIDAMVGEILEKIDLEETCVALLADHATSTRFRRHTADATPITIASTEVVTDGVTLYSERAAYKGGLGNVRGENVLPMLLNIVGKTEKFGA